jgi:hypothetical protein
MPDAGKPGSSTASKDPSKAHPVNRPIRPDRTLYVAIAAPQVCVRVQYGIYLDQAVFEWTFGTVR